MKSGVTKTILPLAPSTITSCGCGGSWNKTRLGRFIFEPYTALATSFYLGDCRISLDLAQEVNGNEKCIYRTSDERGASDISSPDRGSRRLRISLQSVLQARLRHLLAHNPKSG